MSCTLSIREVDVEAEDGAARKMQVAELAKTQGRQPLGMTGSVERVRDAGVVQSPVDDVGYVMMCAGGAKA